MESDPNGSPADLPAPTPADAPSAVDGPSPASAARPSAVDGPSPAPAAAPSPASAAAPTPVIAAARHSRAATIERVAKTGMIAAQILWAIALLVFLFVLLVHRTADAITASIAVVVILGVAYLGFDGLYAAAGRRHARASREHSRHASADGLGRSEGTDASASTGDATDDRATRFTE
ncbi:hypothetical protein [Galbitalea soli]|uniref:Uncharacterized protein n=1 Tax=Galbitalea soli TaxID=1268042 RepID=A0A7C9TSY0_9MICO|nr:hypothetical protein [Galbitalea soli]NEM92200.1 hypothetical protein [Galbitalea soli]NYJ31846.1 hypothetical protein [Galbitalea soli]